MAFKIPKHVRAEIDKLLGQLRDHQLVVEEAVETFNNTIEEAFSKLEGEVMTYDQIKADLHSEIEQLVSDMEGEYDDKSDRWREGDRGEATREWIDALERARDALAGDTDVEKPSLVEAEFNHADEAEADLEDEPGYC